MDAMRRDATLLSSLGDPSAAENAIKIEVPPGRRYIAGNATSTRDPASRTRSFSRRPCLARHAYCSRRSSAVSVQKHSGKTPLLVKK